MAEIPPINPMPGTPAGASPMKKSTGKVQPKKETVRISLPPKPTAAPTIKLPTLPPGGPTGAPSTTAPAFAAPRTAAPAAAAPRPGTAVPAPRPAAARPAAVIVPAIQPLDRVLIFAAAVAGLISVGVVTWVFFTLKSTVENFSS